MPLHIAAQRKIAAYQQQYTDNQNISFLPAIVSTSTACMASFCVFFFYRPTGRLRHTSLPLECHFYNGLKSKVGLAAAKAAALRVNLNVQGCSIVAPPMHATSRTPLLIPLLLSHNLPTPRVR